MADVTYVHLPLEVEENPNLTPTAKKLFWIINSVCMARDFCTYSNKEFAHMLKKKPMRISQCLSILRKNNFIISGIDKEAGNIRRVYIHPDYKAKNRGLVDDYNSRKITGPISKKRYSLYLKKDIGSSTISNDSTRQAIPGIYYVNNMQEPNGSFRAAARVTAISLRQIERVIAYWNSKGKPLARHKHGTKLYREIKRAVEGGLRKYKEAEILKAIDVYYLSLQDPITTLHQYKSPPTKVGLNEFFEFSVMTKNTINAHKIKGFENFKGWCHLCRKGQDAVRAQFARVCKDVHPRLTAMLREELPHVVKINTRDMAVENTLRVAAKKLTRLHEDVKHRIRPGIQKVSPVAFVKAHFFKYLEEQNLERFHFRWLSSDRIHQGFINHIEAMGFLSEPERRRTLKRRSGRDQSIAQRGRNRKADCDRDDCEFQIPEADF